MREREVCWPYFPSFSSFPALFIHLCGLHPPFHFLNTMGFLVAFLPYVYNRCYFILSLNIEKLLINVRVLWAQMSWNLSAMQELCWRSKGSSELHREYCHLPKIHLVHILPENNECWERGCNWKRIPFPWPAVDVLGVDLLSWEGPQSVVVVCDNMEL